MTSEYFGPKDTRTGFWSGVSEQSSIDWCERNYVVTPYVAEFFNSISSLVIMIPALVHLRAIWRFNLEPRFAVVTVWVAAIGAGSFLFHATLLKTAQFADELPMIYAMCAWNYVWLCLHSPRRENAKVVFACLYGVIWTLLCEDPIGRCGHRMTM